jgi:hypothetical protein
VREQIELLEHKANPAAQLVDSLMTGGRGDIEAIEKNLPLLDLLETIDRSDQGRFA